MHIPNLRSRAIAILTGFLVALRLQAAVQVEIGQNFAASSLGVDSDAVPADTTGAVGPSHFVEFLNGRYAVFDKTNGKMLQSLSSVEFWKAAGISIASTLDVTDPRMIFDTDSQRWFALMVDVNISARRQHGNRFLLGISEGSDPTAVWHAVAITADPVFSDFADFPTLGIDADAVYLGGDLFSRSGIAAGPTLLAIPKSDLLSNPPTTAGMTRFGLLTYNQRGVILQPAVTTGAASSTGSVLAVGNDGLDFKSHSTLVLSTVQNGAAANSATLSLPVTLTVPAYKIPINPAQPDGSDNLDNGDARLSACVRRVGDMIYAVHAVQGGSRSVLRWYRIDAVHNSLVESGTISDATLSLFYPSIAANDIGVVVVGCNGASADTFVSSYAVVGETINGALQFGDLTLLKAGEASYQTPDSSGTSRWGDYSATTVDPADPNRFWTIQAYPSDTMTWTTQVTEIITTPIQLAIVRTASGIRISWPSSATSFQLQQSDALSPAPQDWLAAPDLPAIAQNRASILVSPANTARFYRLAAPQSAPPQALR
jgi:hypothetical protein